MGDSSDNVATVALVVSLIALLVTAAQLSAQVFATAEGARKCSYSVLGPWSVSRKPNTRTIWKSRWGEGRLETFYTVPHISLTSSNQFLVPKLYDSSKGAYRPGLTPRVMDDNGTSADRGLDLDSVSYPSYGSRLWGLVRSKYHGSMSLPPDAVLGGDSDLDKLLFDPAYEDRGPDKVGWISFLSFLRVELEIKAKPEVIQERWWDCYPSKPDAKPEESEAGPIAVAPNNFSWPKISYVRHSWDFMPPDAGKPLATCTLGDIALIVRRTGIIWKVFKPEEGRLSAEGGPHVINSFEQRGLGIVLQYRCVDHSLISGIRKETEKQSKKGEQVGNLFSWAQRLEDGSGRREKSDEATEVDIYDAEVNWNPIKFLNWVNMDKVLFGLVPGDPALDVPDFPHNSKDDCINALAEMSDDAGTMRKHLQKWAWCDRYEFNDLLQMVPECFRQRGKGRFPFRTRQYFASIFFWGREGFVTLLTRYLNKEKIIDPLPTRKDDGTETMHYIREKMEWLKSSGEASENLDEKQSLHEETTRYFVAKSDKIGFHDLLKAHCSSAPYASRQSRIDLEKNHPGSLPVSEGHKWRNRNIELYFSYIPKYVTFMQKSAKKHCHDEDLVIEAWFMLMFRGFLLKDLHCFPDGEFEGEYLPRKYYGSRLPIWLA